jgi:hypothetical protein
VRDNRQGVQDLIEIFQSEAYQKDLEGLSSYAASIKQERPMVLFLAKYLYESHRKLALEEEKCDLVIEGTRIEVKFHYDSDISGNLRNVLEKYGTIEKVWQAAQAGQLSKTWHVIPVIDKDVCVKRPDIFVWIICGRDVSKLSEEELAGVCFGKEQRKYNAQHPYGSDGEFLKTADEFLSKLQDCRKFSLETATITTRGIFPSTYHLRMLGFPRPR